MNLPDLPQIRRVSWVVACVCWLILPSSSWGQLIPLDSGRKPAPDAPPLPLAAEIEELKAENTRALRIAQKAKEGTEASKSGPPVPDAATREIELRTQLGYTLDQLKSATERETQLQANTGLTTEQRAATLREIQLKAERSIGAALGPKVFEAYRRYTGQWIQNLNPSGE